MEKSGPTRCHDLRRDAAALEVREPATVGWQTAGGSWERRLADAVRRTRHDDTALLGVLGGLRDWQRLGARLVLGQELGGARARDLCVRAFGEAPLFSMTPAPPVEEAAPPGLRARWDLARARALDELLTRASELPLDAPTVRDLLLSFPPHVQAAALCLGRGRGRVHPIARQALPGLFRSEAALAPAVERRAATLLRQEATAADAADPDHPAVEEAIRRCGEGAPLPERTRREMSARFGVDLRRVRVHTDAIADRAAAALHAVAFTVGEDVFFSAGAFAPERAAGRRLLLHELTHVVQWLGGRAVAPAAGRRVAGPEDALESEARAVAAVDSAAPVSQAPSLAVVATPPRDALVLRTEGAATAEGVVETATQLAGEEAERVALERTRALPVVVQEGGRRHGDGRTTGCPLSSDEERRHFLRAGREYFGSFDAAIEHFMQIERAAVPGDVYLHAGAARGLERAIAALGDGDAPSATVSFSFRHAFTSSTTFTSSSMHSLGYAVDFQAYENPHLRRDQEDMIRLVTGEAGHAQLPADRFALIREMGQESACSVVGDGEAVPPPRREEAAELLDQVVREAERLAATSVAFQRSLGGSGEDFLALRTRYFEALRGDDDEAAATAAQAVLAEVPGVIAPWLEALERERTRIGTGGTEDEQAQVDVVEHLLERLADPAFLFGQAGGEGGVGTRLTKEAPSLAQMVENGFFNPADGYEPPFFRALVQNGFDLGMAAWTQGRSTADSMHVEFLAPSGGATSACDETAATTRTTEGDSSEREPAERGAAQSIDSSVVAPEHEHLREAHAVCAEAPRSQHRRQICEGYWLGEVFTSDEIPDLVAANIHVVLSAVALDDETLAALRAAGIAPVSIRMTDRFSHADTILEAAARYPPSETLIHCTHGADRTGATAAFLLVMRHGWTIPDALYAVLYPDDADDLAQVLRDHHLDDTARVTIGMYAPPSGGLKAHTPRYRLIIDDVIEEMVSRGGGATAVVVQQETDAAQTEASAATGEESSRAGGIWPPTGEPPSLLDDLSPAALAAAFSWYRAHGDRAPVEGWIEAVARHLGAPGVLGEDFVNEVALFQHWYAPDVEELDGTLGPMTRAWLIDIFPELAGVEDFASSEPEDASLLGGVEPATPGETPTREELPPIEGDKLHRAMAVAHYVDLHRGTVAFGVAMAICENESQFDPDAANASGALGLWQVMPAYFADWNCPSLESRADPAVSTRGVLEVTGRHAATIAAEYPDLDEDDRAGLLYYGHAEGMGNLRTAARRAAAGGQPVNLDSVLAARDPYNSRSGFIAIAVRWHYWEEAHAALLAGTVPGNNDLLQLSGRPAHDHAAEAWHGSSPTGSTVPSERSEE